MNERPSKDHVPVVSPYPRDNRPAEPPVWSERFPWWLFPYLSSGTCVGFAFVKGNFQWESPSLLILCFALFLIACPIAFFNLATIIRRAIQNKGNDSVKIANAVLSFNLMLGNLTLWPFIIIGD